LLKDGAASLRSPNGNSACARVNPSGSRPTISRSGARAGLPPVTGLSPVNAVFPVGLAVPALVVDVKILAGRHQ
jgi:hypothetical protein